MNFKPGDTIRRSNDGQTAIVHHIDPACNNVYVFGERWSDGTPYGDLADVREITPRYWTKVQGESVTPEKKLAAGECILVLYRLTDGCNYQGRRVKISTIYADGHMQARARVESLGAELSEGEYRAVVVFWDADVNEFTFTVTPPPTTNEVTFK